MIKLLCDRCKGEIAVNHQIKEIPNTNFDLCGKCYQEFRGFMRNELL